MFSRESASDKWIDDSHLGEGNSQSPAHMAPGNIRALLGTLQQDSSGRIHFRQAGVGFDKADRHPLGGEMLLDDVFRLCKALFNVPENKVGGIGDIAALEFIDQGCVGLQGILGGQHHRKLLVFHVNQIQGLLGRILVYGCHGCNAFTKMVNLGNGHGQLIPGIRSRPVWLSRKVFARNHRHNTGKRLRPGRIDIDNVGMGLRTSQDFAMQHSGCN